MRWREGGGQQWPEAELRDGTRTTTRCRHAERSLSADRARPIIPKQAFFWRSSSGSRFWLRVAVRQDFHKCRITHGIVDTKFTSLTE